MRSEGVAKSDFELTQFELPRYSRYEVTVYPLRQDANTYTEATVELANTSAKRYVTAGLVAGLGEAEELIASTILKPPNPSAKIDGGLLRWQVTDSTA